MRLCRRLTRTGNRYLNLWSLTASFTLVSCLCLHITHFSSQPWNIPLPLSSAAAGRGSWGNWRKKCLPAEILPFVLPVVLPILHIKSPALLRRVHCSLQQHHKKQKSLVDCRFFSCHVPRQVFWQPAAQIIRLQYPQLHQNNCVL